MRRRRLLAVAALLAVIVALPVLAFNFAPAEAPEEVPEITFLDADGNSMTLADFRGKVVVLNLWATWCAPCRREMPSLDRLQAQYGGEDLQVVPLSQDRGDSLAKIQAFYDELGLESLPIYRDPEAKAARELKAPGLPTTLVLDREGREVGRVLGHAEWDSGESLELIQAVLDG